MFISRECWQPKRVTKGRVCKTGPLPLSLSHFLDRKKEEMLFWLLCVFFLVTNSLQTLARSPWFCCLPEGCAGSVGNISSCPDAQVSALWPLCHPWGYPLWSAGCWGSCSGLRRYPAFRATVCLDIGHQLGSYLKTTCNKKQIMI